ncbi:hypothetical protein, partial [Frankia sp. CIT1]|uniref:hypothetical protein n=1 Tax=Frankia sp. CIT1 TaxID=2880974 RepID=UPI001EF406F4
MPGAEPGAVGACFADRENSDKDPQILVTIKTDYHIFLCRLPQKLVIKLASFRAPKPPFLYSRSTLPMYGERPPVRFDVDSTTGRAAVACAREVIESRVSRGFVPPELQERWMRVASEAAYA